MALRRSPDNLPTATRKLWLERVKGAQRLLPVAGVVDKDYFQRRIGLRAHAFQRLEERVRTIAGRDANADKGVR